MSKKRNEQKRRRQKAKTAAIARYRAEAEAATPPKKRRRLSVFYTVYFALILLFVIALIIGSFILHDVLAEYESVQPEYTAEEIFREHFAEPDIASLIEMSSTEYALFEPAGRVAEYLSEQIEGKEITYSPSSIKESDGILAYNVFCGGARFAVFSIEQGEETSGYGFPIYRLREVGLTFSLPENGYGYVIPEGYTLYANGIEVGSRFISDDPIRSDAYNITEGALGVRYVSYWVEGFLSQPTFTVKDTAGTECEAEYDEERGIFFVDAPSITLTLPEGYTPYIGGYAVGEAYRLPDSTQPSVYNAFLHENAAPLNYTSYEVGGLFDLPEVTVRAPDGRECEVRHSEGAREYTALPAADETLRAEHEEHIIEAFELLTLYLQNMEGVTKAEVSRYFDTSSEAWAGYSSIYPNWNFEAFYYRFEDESADSFISYDEDHFSCRVRMHYIGNRTATAVYEDKTDKLVFFRRAGDRFVIYNMPNTESVSGLGI